MLPEGVGEMGQGRQTVDQVVGHVEELELVGSGREGGAHDQVHLDRRQHRAQRVQLRSSTLASASVHPSHVGQTIFFYPLKIY